MSGWLAWAWVIAVDLAIVVAAAFATYDRHALASLRPQHVAAATIVALVAWESAANVVASVVGATEPFSGLDVAFLAAQALFAGAAAVMVAFLLRRRRWAVVLGIGLALARFLLAILGLIDFMQAAGGLEGSASTVAFVLLGALPLLLAIWLFLDPFLRGQLAWRPVAASEPSASGEPSAASAEARSDA